MRVKKWTSLLLASAMVFSLTACGNSKDATADISGANVDTGVSSDNIVDNAYNNFVNNISDDTISVIKPDLSETELSDLQVYVKETSPDIKLVTDSDFKGNISDEEYVNILNESDNNMTILADIKFSYDGKNISYPFEYDTIVSNAWNLSDTSKALSCLSSCGQSYYLHDNNLTSLILQSYNNENIDYINAGSYNFLKSAGIYQFSLSNIDDSSRNDFPISINDVQLTTATFSDIIDLWNDLKLSDIYIYDESDNVDITYNKDDGKFYKSDINSEESIVLSFDDVKSLNLIKGSVTIPVIQYSLNDTTQILRLSISFRDGKISGIYFGDTII